MVGCQESKPEWEKGQSSIVSIPTVCTVQYTCSCIVFVYHVIILCENMQYIYEVGHIVTPHIEVVGTTVELSYNKLLYNTFLDIAKQ